MRFVTLAALVIAIQVAFNLTPTLKAEAQPAHPSLSVSQMQAMCSGDCQLDRFVQPGPPNEVLYVGGTAQFMLPSDLGLSPSGKQQFVLALVVMDAEVNYEVYNPRLHPTPRWTNVHVALLRIFEEE